MSFTSSELYSWRGNSSTDQLYLGHFGLNTFFADNGLEDGYPTRLYFPADVHQMTAIVKKVFWDMGLRFVFSTRSKVPNILKEGTQDPYFGGDYEFMPGKDEVSLTKRALVGFRFIW